MSCRPSSPPPPLSPLLPSLHIDSGGLDDAIFIDPPSQTRGLHCPICFLILRDPILLSCCGKHICQVCIDPIVSADQPCPCCREQSFKRLLNKEKKQEILALRVYCSNKKLGCDWIGELCDEERHLVSRCKYIPKDCQYGCGQLFLSSYIQTHEQYECVKRPIQVILDVFMKQTADKMAEQERLLAEMSEQVKRYKKQEQQMMKEIKELKDRTLVNELEIVEENIYVDKGMWQFACSTAFKENWFDMSDRMQGKGITLSMNEDNSCMTVKGERRVIGVGRDAIRELEASVRTSRIATIHQDAAFYLTHYPNAIKEIEKNLQVHIQLQEQVEIEPEIIEDDHSDDVPVTSINTVYTFSTSKGQTVNLLTGNMLEYTDVEVTVFYCTASIRCLDEVAQGAMAIVGKEALRDALDEQSEKRNTGVQIPNSMIVTAGDGRRKAAILAVVPHYDTSEFSFERHLSLVRRTISSIFKNCCMYSSVVLPSVGNDTPHQALYASALLHEISSYFDNPQSNLKTVNIFLTDSEIEVYSKYLEDEFDSIDSNAIPSSPPSPTADRFLRMLPNGVLFRVLYGDITCQNVDVVVVVNSSIPDLARVGSCISRSLLSKGGKALQALRENQTKQGLRPSEGRAVETRCEGMGTLVCKSLFHTVLNTTDLRKSVLSCLDRAEKMRYTSIAFPRIWSKEVPMNRVIANLKNALKQFAKRNPSSVKVINMMFLNSDTFEQFQEIFGNDEGLAVEESLFVSPMKTSTPSKATPTEATPTASSISRGDSIDKSNDECSATQSSSNGTASVTIYGLDMTSVEKAKNTLQNLIDVLL